MNKLLFGFLLICLFSMGFTSELRCKDFKNGKFKLVVPEGDVYFIERHGSKQIEYDPKSKIKLQFKVKWVDECTYTLSLKKIIDNPNNVPVMKGMIVKVQIGETKEKSYLQRSTTNVSDRVYPGEMFLVEDEVEAND